MPKLRHKSFEIFPWIGGLNALNDPQLVDPKLAIVHENFVMDKDGTKQKRGGQTKFNSIAIGTANVVDGGFHFKKSGALGDTFKTVVVSDELILKSDEDGVFDDITGTAFVETAIYPDFTVFNNEVIISWSTSDTALYSVLKWDQIGNVAALGGTPPDFAFSTVYSGRVYGAGDPANKSRLSASALLDHEDWTIGVNPQDAFTVDINPNDGDEIAGSAQAFGRLYVFKKNNIFSISGTLQSDIRVAQAAVLTKDSGNVLAGNIGAVNHRTIVNTSNDVFFLSFRGAHSLAATEKFGDVEQNFLSFPIQDLYANGLNHSQSEQWSGIFSPSDNSVFWAVAREGSSKNNIILCLNIEIGQWFILNIEAAHLFLRDINNKLQVFACGYDGFVRRINDPTNLSDDGAGYTAIVKTPVLDFGDRSALKKVKKVTFFYVPKGKFPATVRFSFDNGPLLATTFDMDAGGGSAVLGDFILGTDVWAGGTIEPKSVPIEGVGKTFQMSIENGVVGQDMEILGYRIDYIPGKPSYENVR